MMRFCYSAVMWRLTLCGANMWVCIVSDSPDCWAFTEARGQRSIRQSRWNDIWWLLLDHIQSFRVITSLLNVGVANKFNKTSCHVTQIKESDPALVRTPSTGRPVDWKLEVCAGRGQRSVIGWLWTQGYWRIAIIRDECVKCTLWSLCVNANPINVQGIILFFLQRSSQIAWGRKLKANTGITILNNLIYPYKCNCKG